MEEEVKRKEYEKMNSWSRVVLRFCAVFFALKREQRSAFRFSTGAAKVRALAPASIHGEEAGGKKYGPT